MLYLCTLLNSCTVCRIARSTGIRSMLEAPIKPTAQVLRNTCSKSSALSMAPPWHRGMASGLTSKPAVSTRCTFSMASSSVQAQPAPYQNAGPCQPYFQVPLLHGGPLLVFPLKRYFPVRSIQERMGSPLHQGVFPAFQVHKGLCAQSLSDHSRSIPQVWGTLFCMMAI